MIIEFIEGLIQTNDAEFKRNALVDSGSTDNVYRSRNEFIDFYEHHPLVECFFVGEILGMKSIALLGCHNKNHL